MMTSKNSQHISSRSYETIRNKFIEHLKTTKKTEEHKAAISKALKGIKLSDERKRDISKSRTGQKLSQEFKDNRSKQMIADYASGKRTSAMTGTKHTNESRKKIADGLIAFYKDNKHYVVTSEHKAKLSNALKKGYADGTIIHAMQGKKQSDESKEKNRQKALNRPRIQCPHCLKIGPKPNMIQHHFDKCRSITTNTLFKGNAHGGPIQNL